MRKLKKWVLEILPFIIAIIIVVGGVFSLALYTNYNTNYRKDECIAQYDSSFQSQVEEWKTRDRCEELICDELNLGYDGSGSWAKATIDCLTKSGGRITLKMSQHNEGDDDCRNYFVARLEQAICLEKAGYLKEAD